MSSSGRSRGHLCHLCHLFASVPSLLTVFSVLVVATTPIRANAQSTSKSQSSRTTALEGRADAIISNKSTAQVGIGLSVFGGTYVRLGVVGAVGGGADGVASRIDGFARFYLDPFRQSRWGLYGGGGLSTRFDEGSRPRAYMLIFAGVDGPVRNGLTTSFEVGLGGGARIGVILRQSVAERR